MLRRSGALRAASATDPHRRAPQGLGARPPATDQADLVDRGRQKPCERAEDPQERLRGREVDPGLPPAYGLLLKVSHEAGRPDWKPTASQCWRCAEEPWVHSELSTTRPAACC